VHHAKQERSKNRKHARSFTLQPAAQVTQLYGSKTGTYKNNEESQPGA